MSKTLIKTMIAELGTIIPKDELDKIADKITEVITLKTKATRSNIDPLAKSERVKSTILQLGNIKEEIIEKLYDHGVEEPDKIRAIAMKTMQKIDKAMESKYVIRDARKNEAEESQELTEPVIVQDPTAPKQGEPSTPKDDKDKVDDGGNNIISNISENRPQRGQRTNSVNFVPFIDGKFKIALNERPNEIENIYQKYKEGPFDTDTYPLEFKKSIIKANKIFNNIDEYFDIPEEVPTPTFEEIFNAVEQTKEKRKLKKLINLSEIIEENRRKSRIAARDGVPKETKAKTENANSVHGAERQAQRIGKLKFK